MQTYWGGKWKEWKDFWVLNNRIWEERLMFAVFPDPLNGLRMGLGPGIFHLARDKESLQPMLGWLPCVEISFQTHVFSFFLFKHIYYMASDQLHYYLCSLQGEDGVLLLQHKRGYVSQLPYIRGQKRPIGHEGPMPSEADLALPLLYGQPSVCILFSLVTQYWHEVSRNIWTSTHNINNRYHLLDKIRQPRKLSDLCTSSYSSQKVS